MFLRLKEEEEEEEISSLVVLRLQEKEINPTGVKSLMEEEEE